MSDSINIHFAKWIANKAETNKETVQMTALLLGNKTTEGHVCIDLKQYANTENQNWKAPPLQQWKEQLLQSKVVATDNAPLILSKNRIYLYRHYQDEQRVAHSINKLRQQPDKKIKTNTKTDHIKDKNQKKAIDNALRKHICVISGGPGTGKTTIMVEILKLLKQQDKNQVIKLAAPTGRAAARMKKAITDKNQQAETYTLHRLMNIRPGQGSAAHATPIDADILIVDEASMISLELMARLLSSIRENTRIILIGDKHQLYSVAAGSVFSDICNSDITTELTKNYRFKQDSGIAQLAQAINQGDEKKAIQAAKNSKDINWIQDYTQINKHIQKTADRMWCENITRPHLQELETARILAVTQYDKDYINQYIKQQRPQQREGTQIMITTNNERTKLFNGDIGITTKDTVLFTDNREIPINQIPTHELAWAITVHKSQGSEFNNITIITPKQTHQLISRELLYTAITRARHTVTIIATEQTIKHAVNTPIARMSGLSERLK